jgi:hypothetical protein
METKTGIQKMSAERRKHWKKHGRTVTDDRKLNKKRQLLYAAYALISDRAFITEPPDGWDLVWWTKMRTKPLKEWLIIAGSLLAAEYDRLYLFK